MSTDVLFKIQNNTGLILLNRPKTLNASSIEILDATFQTLAEWKTNSKVQRVIIGSECAKAFCAGGDLRYVYENRNNPENLSRLFDDEYRFVRLVHHYPKPYISLLNGITMGGGVGLGLHGSHRIAGDDLTLAMPETKIGFFPDITSSYLLNRCPGKLGLYLALSSRSINAADAYALGLVDAIVSAGQLNTLRKELLESSEPFEKIIEAHRLPLQASTLLSHQLNIDTHFSKPSVQTIMHSLSLDSDIFCQALYQDLQSKSPLSLAVTFRQHEITKNLSFDECNALDLKLANHFIKDTDFFEGIRAHIIDKTRDPRWDPIKIEDVSEEMVDQYFQ